MKQTTNYSIFKHKDGNRIINEKHVQKIKDSIIKHDYLPSCPIIVDEDYNVIDGQHRLEAAKQLGIAVWYIVEHEPDEDLLIDLNITQRKWTAGDYINYFADKQKNENYIRFRQLMREVPMDINSLLDMAKGVITGGQYINDYIKKGKLEITAAEIQRAHHTYEYMLQLRDALRCKLTGRMVRAIVQIQRHPKFSWTTMIYKAKKYYVKSYPCTTKQEWHDMIVMLYNYNGTASNKIK